MTRAAQRDASHAEAVREAFAAIADMDRAARHARLDGLDADVRAEVERLLANDDAMRAAGGTPDDRTPVRELLERAFESPADPGAPVRIGPYRVLERLSAGGMGAVFVCADSGGARVAVKVLHPVLCSAGIVRRFEHEAEALRRLDDPSVVRILSHGTAELGLGAQPYIAMELVEGAPLDEHARGLTRSRRLALLAEVARAVHRVHLRGIVHRDLKPANVLVTPAGIPTLVDFGVAHVGAGPDPALTALTLAGQLPGTLAYMSPEQARGEDPDPRADVYALGAVAYELLTGRPPISVEGSPIGATLAAITGTEPRRPRAIDPTITRDAELVIRRALAKAPEDRYQSAAELADEFDRVARGDAVVVRAPGVFARVRRWARRHPVAAWCSTVAAMALLALALTAGALVVHAAGAERRARQWEGTTGEAFDVLERLLVGASRNHLGPDASAHDLLGAIASQVNDLATTPEARASAFSNIAYAYFLIEDYDEAIAWYDRSVPAAEAVHGSDAPAVALERYRLALSQAASGDPGTAIETADDALDRMRDPRTPGDTILISELQLARGIGLLRLRRHAEARVSFDRARVLALDAGGPDHPRHIKALLNIARTDIAAGDGAPALEMLDEVIERNLRIRGESHARTWGARIARAEALHGIGRHDESEREFRSALGALERSHAPDHPAVAYARAGLGRSLLDAGRVEGARAILEDVVSGEPRTWWLGIREAGEYEEDLRRAERASRPAGG